MIGTILFDYLHPMLDDPYLFESTFYHLIQSLQRFPQKSQILLKTIELIIPDLKSIISRLFNLIVR